MIEVLLAAAKKAITMKRCRFDSPIMENWLDTVKGILDRERLTTETPLETE